MEVKEKATSGRNPGGLSSPAKSILGIGAIAVVAIAGLSALAFKSCTNSLPGHIGGSVGGQQWCNGQQSTRPFAGMVDQATHGQEFPRSKANTFFMASTPLTPVPQSIEDDAKTVSDAVFPGLYGSTGAKGRTDPNYRIAASTAPAVRAAALRLDAYCATVAP